MMATAVDSFALRAPQPAPMRAAPLAMATLGMGAPILTALAASAMPMTGLDFLTQRAGVARPSVDWLPASYQLTSAPLGALGQDGAGAAAPPLLRRARRAP